MSNNNKKRSKVNTNNRNQQNRMKQTQQVKYQTTELSSVKYNTNLNQELTETAVEAGVEMSQTLEDTVQNNSTIKDSLKQSGSTEMTEQKEKSFWEARKEELKKLVGIKDDRFDEIQLSGEGIKVDREYLRVVESQLDNIQEYLTLNINEFSRVEAKLTEAQSQVSIELKREITDSNQYIDKLREQLNSFNTHNAASFEALSTSVGSHFEQLKSTLTKLDHFGEIIREVKKGNGQVLNLKQDVTDVARNLNTLSNTISENTRKELRNVKNTLEELPEVFDQELYLTKRLKNIEKTTETIQGALQTLQNQDQSEIKELLQDKTISFKKEFPVMNEDEETIIELTKYSEYINEQLSLAARHYARNRQVIEDIHEERNRHGQQLKNAKVQAHQTGITEGKTAIIKQLLANYHDIHALFESSNEEVQILMTFLKNQGLSVDEELLQGTVIEITDDMRQPFELKASFEGLGEFEVVKPAYLLNDIIYQKAVLAPYVEPEIEDKEEQLPLVDHAEALTESSEENVTQVSQESSEFHSIGEEKQALGTESEQPLEELAASIEEVEQEEAEIDKVSESESVEDISEPINEQEGKEENKTVISE